MSDRSVLVALLCSLLVVSAGCATFTSNDAESTTPPTTEPATTTTEPPSTTGSTDNGTTDSADQLAPGLTTDGVTDAAALADAHQAALGGEPFVKHSSRERSNATASASKRMTFFYANDSYWYSTATSEGLPVDIHLINGTAEMYTDEDVVLTRRQTDGNVSYSVIEIAPSELSDDVYSRALVYALFLESNVTIEDSSGAVTRVTGTVDTLGFGTQTATNIEFTANVTETGLVQSLDLTYQQGNATVERSLSFEKTDENPFEQPEWYETALNQTRVNKT